MTTASLFPPGSTEVRSYWQTGDGLPTTGTFGFDAEWFDADGRSVGACVNEVDGKVPITEAEYDVLVEAWATYDPTT